MLFLTDTKYRFHLSPEYPVPRRVRVRQKSSGSVAPGGGFVID